MIGRIKTYLDTLLHQAAQSERRLRCPENTLGQRIKAPAALPAEKAPLRLTAAETGAPLPRVSPTILEPARPEVFNFRFAANRDFKEKFERLAAALREKQDVTTIPDTNLVQTRVRPKTATFLHTFASECTRGLAINVNSETLMEPDAARERDWRLNTCGPSRCIEATTRGT